MSTIENFLTVPQEGSSSNTAPAVSFSVPSTQGESFIPQQAEPSQQDWWNNFAEAPSSKITQLEPVSFDWERSGAPRFAESNKLKQLGFDPYLGGKESDGKFYSANELKYQQAQTWGDVMKNAMGQFGGLAWNSFKSAAVSDGRFISALFNSDSWKSNMDFVQATEGTPEQLLEQDKELKNIMNKYAIYNSPETDNSVLNKEMAGNLIGQFGFTVGTGGYILGQNLLFSGILSGVNSFKKGRDLAKIGKLMETLNTTGKGLEAETIYANYEKSKDAAKALKELTALNDIGKNRNLMESIFTGMKNLVPGYEAVNDSRLALNAGATFNEAIGAGLPGFIKSYTMFNAARAEAGMEAAGTYGEMYMGLIDEYERKNGKLPVGQDLQRIKDAAYGASTDNFIVNTGLLMTANSIEFGALMSKFKPAKRLMREAAENANAEEAKAMFGISGKALRDIGETKAGQYGTKFYKTGRFGAMSKLNTIRKDFGLGTALYEGAKSWGKGAAKFEFTEGLQEILQETSNKTISDYYTNLYDANKKIDGSALTDISTANWKEGLGEQMNMQGWKTFLMGATTGLFLSPISGAVMYGREKAVGAANKEYGEMMKKRKATIDENIAISNQWYGNVFNSLREHVAAFKTSTHAAKTMMEALGENDKYVFLNSQDDVLTKAAAVAFKTGNGEHFVNSIRALGDGRMTDEEFREAFGIPDTGTGKPFNAKVYVDEIANKIENYYSTMSNIKDQFADRIMPALENNAQSVFYNNVQKKAFDEVSELIATLSYHANSVNQRAVALKQRVSQIPNIGQANSRAFELFGNPYEIAETIKMEQAKIQSYEGVNTDDAKELRKNAENNIQLLEAWSTLYKQYQELRNASKEEYTKEGFTKNFTAIEESLMNTFKRFLEANNRDNGRSTIIDMNNVREAFTALGDYIKLNEDFGQYTQAVNIITDPSNFTSLHEKIAKGMISGLASNSIKHKEEIKERAAAVTPEEGRVEETTTGKPEDITIESVAYKVWIGLEDTLTPEEQTFYAENKEAIDDEILKIAEKEAMDEELAAQQAAAEAEGAQTTEEGEEREEEGTVTPPPALPVSKLSPEMEAIKKNIVGAYILSSTKLTPAAKQFLDENPELKEQLDQERVNLEAQNLAGLTPQEISAYVDTKYKPVIKSLIEDYMVALQEKEKGAQEEGEKKTQTETETGTETTSAPGTPVSDIDAQRAEIERRRQEKLKQLNDNDKQSLEARMPNNPNHSTFKVGMKYDDGMNVSVQDVKLSDNFDGREDSYVAITKIIEPAEFGADGKMTKAATVETTIFNNKEEADKAIADRYAKIQAQVKEGKRQKDANAKYDAELAALEQQGTGTVTPTTEVVVEPGAQPAIVAVERTGRFPLSDLTNLNRTYLPEQLREAAMEQLRNLSLFNRNQINPDAITIKIVRNIYDLRQVEGGFQIFHSVLDEPRGKVYEKLEDAEAVLARQLEPTYLSKGMAKGYPLKRDEFQVGIYSNDVLIGFINSPQRFDEILSNITSADEFVQYVDPGTDSKEVAFSKWQSAKAQIDQLQRLIDSVMDNDTDIQIIDGSQLSDIINFYRLAEFDKQNTPDQVLNRPTLKDIESAGGEVVMIRRTDDPNYVVNRSAIYQNETVPNIPPNLQRQYVALIRKDNGLFWVEIAPSVISDAAFNSQLQEAYNLLQSVSDGTGNPSTVVTQLRDIFSNFISSDPNSILNFLDIEVGLFDGGTSVKLSLKVNPKTLKLINQSRSAKDKIKPFYATLLKVQQGKDISNTWVAGENKIQGLLDAINSVDKDLQKWASDKNVSLKKQGEKENEHLNVTRTMLRVTTPKDPSMNDLMEMQAGVSTDIIKNYTIVYSPLASSLPEKNVPPIEAENKNQKVSVAGGTTVVENETSSEQQNAEPIITTAEQDEQIIDAVVETISANAGVEEILANLLSATPPPPPSSDIANKIMSVQQFTDSSIVTNEAFTNWCATNLPIDIIIEDLGVLSSNLLSENIIAGQFITSLRTIQIYRNSPSKYHEAFHAVFRLLLTDEKIAQLYALAAKEHPVTQEKLDKFRQQYTMYAYMDDQQLAERYLEEYLADKFDAWMMNRNVRTASPIKAFFNRLLEWIENVLTRLTGSDIESFFYDINKGKYKNARIQDNQFTNDEITASIPALKLIKVGYDTIIGIDGKPTTVPRYLQQQTGEQLASTITALFQQMRNNSAEQMSNNDLLDSILNMYADTLNPLQKHYNDILAKIGDPFALPGEPGNEYNIKVERVKWVKKLNDAYTVFVNAESRASIKEAVQEHLKIMGYKVGKEEDDLEGQEARDGVRTTADYNKEADMFGGYSSLSKIIREYIGSTTMPVADEFGNEHFLTKDGVKLQPMIQAVPAAHVYNGMMKTFANISDEVQLMNRMLNYIKEGRNPSTIAFINYVLEQTGFETNNEGEWIVPKNPLLLMQVLKEFNKYETNPLFIELTFGQTVKAYNSNRQDSAKVQFEKWSEANQRQYMSQLNKAGNKKSVVDKAFGPLSKLQNLMANANKDQKIEDVTLTNTANEISGELKNLLGIDLHPSFIKFSIISTKAEEVRTPDQNILYNAWVTISPITVEDINGIKSAMDTKVGNIFSLEFGAATRLLQIAASNAYFDETVDSMTYMGADGEMRYVSQFPNYNMVRVRQFNEKKVIEELRNSPDHRNFLLDQSSDFMILSGQGKIRTQNIDGLKVKVPVPGEDENKASLEEQGDNRDVGYTAGNLEGSTGEGIAFKFMDDAEHQLFLLSGYGAQNGKIQTGPKKSEYFYTVPVMISVVEAKSTANIVRMPVIDTVSTQNNRTSITSDTLDKFYSFVEQEIEMIKRVNEEIENGQGNIAGYHTGKKNPDGTWEVAPRGLRLYNTKLWFSPEFRAKIEANALNPEYVPTEDDKREIKAAINSYLQGKIDAYINYLAKLDLINLQNNNAETSLLPGFVYDGFKDPSTERDQRMNLIQGNFRHNISQIFLNDFLNTIALRQLLYGNEAKAFKDNIDRIKRMAGPNSSGRNVSFIFTAPDLGINHTFTKFHHVTYKSTPFKKMNGNKPGDKDDAQMYCTAKGMRYALFGFGKLTKQQADIISKMERGEPVTEEEFFGAGGIKENKGATNSMKVVYFDNNNVYLKCSMIPLYRELTSLPDSRGGWIAKPYMTELHNLLNKLEEYEAGIRRDENNYIIRDEDGMPVNFGETVVYAGPDTHSKGLKENVAESMSAINNTHFQELETKYFRLQMENPSNKLVITDPTQAKQQIMSEQDDSVMVNFFGEEKTVGEIKRMYMMDVSQRLTNNYESAVRQMFTLDEGFIELNKSINLNKVTPQLANFFTIMKETLQATGSNQQVLDFLEVREGEPIYDMNFPAILPKYTQIFFSYFSKVMAEKTPGITVALVSDAGIQRIKEVLEVFPKGHERAGQPKRWRVVTDAEYTRNPAKYQGAKKWNNKEERTYVDLKKGDYIIDDLRHNYMKYDENGKELGYFSEYMRPAHWKEEMGGIVKALMYGFGIRIPSDDKHQYITLEMVDTLPVMYGSSAVFPQELLEISGADFDIDKLYIQLADTYIDAEGNRVAYGTATTKQEKFDEYVQWQLANNKALSEYFKENFTKDPDVQSLFATRDMTKDQLSELTQQIIDNNRFLGDPEGYNKLFKDTKKELLAAFNITSQEVNELIDAIKSSQKSVIKNGLAEQGLPSTPDAYAKMVEKGNEPNNGVLNNRILAAKIAMLNNEKISGGGKNAIINTATSTDALTNLVKDLIEAFSALDTPGARAILEILREDEIDINDLQGKSTSFINNKEGQRNIGAAINSMLVFSLAEQLGLEVSDAGIYHNSIAYRKFENANTTDGVRKFAQISAIVNAMTDNAKERLAAKLGLNIQAVGMTATMVALGIPLKESVLYMLQPGVRRFFAALRRNNSALNQDMKLSPNTIIKRYVNAATKKLIEDYKLSVDKFGEPIYTDEVKEKMNMTEEKLLQNISENGSDSAFELSTLLNFKYAMELSDEFRNAASVMKLNQGMDTTWEENDETLEKIGNLVKYNDKGKQISKMDFFGPLVLQHPIFSTYINILNQVNELAPKIFLERTPAFIKMSNLLFANMNIPNKEFNVIAKNDIISYLSIKAYINWLGKKGFVNVLKTLKGALIYPSLQEKENPDFKNIAAIIRNLRQNTNNYMVNEFLRYVEANDETNKGNINKAVSNIWARLSENEQQRLYDSFIDLYNSEKTKADAIALFNYLLVKDGGQFRSGSFIKYIPPFAFKDLLDRTKEINEMFANNDETEENYMRIFGVNREELLTNFMLGYGTHILNRNNIKSIVPTVVMDMDIQVKEGESIADINKEEVNNFTAQPIVAVGDTITIDLFKDIRPSILVSRNQYGLVVEEGKKGKFSPTEKQLKKKNELAIERSGFQLVEGEKGYEIAFPFTIMKKVEKVDTDGNSTGESYKVLFQLQSVGKMTGTGSTSAMLDRGEYTPTGVSAIYVQVEHTGSFETWRAESAIGEVPVTPKKSNTPFNVDGAQYSPSIDELYAEMNDVEPVAVEQKPAPTPAPQIKGENIASTSKGIAAALTNPTELAKQKGNLVNSYPVVYNGVTYKDAEAAYQANKAPYLANKTTGKLMVDIITAKLQQHPSLIKGIDAKGGLEWLRNSTHIVKGDNFWETGEGKENGFMRALIQAYKAVTAQGNTKLLKNENGLIIAENVIPKNETIKIAEEAKEFIKETSFKQTAGSVSWGYGMQWMRINAMTPKQREGLVIGQQLNGRTITQAMKDSFIKTGDAKGFPLYGYTTIDKNGKELPKIPQNIVNYLASIGIDVSQYDASYNSVYDKSDSGSLIIHQDNTETNKSPIITISLGRPMKFVTYELNNANDFNVADSDNTAFRIAVNAVSGEALKLNIIPQSELDKSGKIKYGHLTPDTLLKYAEQIDKIQKTQLKQFVIDKLKEQFKNSEKTEYNLTNGAVLVFSGSNRNVLHEIVFDPETNKKPMESGFPTLTVNKAFKGLGQADKMVNTNDYRMVLTLRKVTGPTLTNVVNEQKLVQSLSQTVQAPVTKQDVSLEQVESATLPTIKVGDTIRVVTSDGYSDQQIKGLDTKGNKYAIYYVNRYGVDVQYRGEGIRNGKLYPTEIKIGPKPWSKISTASYVHIELPVSTKDKQADSIQTPISETNVSLPSEQMTSEQWKQELSDIYSSKERTEGKREWETDKWTYIDVRRGAGVPDATILEEIKACK